MQQQVISATQARNNFSELLSLVLYKRERFFIKRKGRLVAVLGPGEQLQSKQKAGKEKVIKRMRMNALGVSDNWVKEEKELGDLHRCHG